MPAGSPGSSARVEPSPPVDSSEAARSSWAASSFPLQEGKTLQECSGFQGIVCGQLITLKMPNRKNITTTTTDTDVDTDADEEIVESVDLTPGDTLFFSNDTVLPEEIFSKQNLYLLIVYGHYKTVYTKNGNDPSNHYLKRYGYSFGDLLHGDNHPLFM